MSEPRLWEGPYRQDQLGGRKGTCPDCGAPLIIPNVPASRTGDLTAEAPSPLPKEGCGSAADIQARRDGGRNARS